MLDVEMTHQIILMHFVEGLSVRKIAQKLKIHRKTVTSRIEQYNRFKNGTGSEKGPSTIELAKYLKTGTVYDSSGREARKISAAISERIDQCLAENEEKRLDGRRKQQLRKIDIHEILIAAGFEIGYSTVCRYIAGKAMATQEAFIKQDYVAGGTCEFDWGEVNLYIAGKRRRYYLAVFTSAYSNYRYAILFERQHSLAYREAHIIFFAHVGGVWRQMTYDNMRVAVAQFVGKTEKVPTSALIQLSRWYLFQWRFCNAARGNEKGHVERSVE
ncbi:MAG: sigma factor-like helix-turn-helix DNA-binding protein, partial [Candidatus Saccharimonadales bacterium]